MKHPQNRFERRLVNAKKRKKAFKGKEVLQDQETKGELVTYRKLGDLQEEYRRRSSSVPVSGEGNTIGG